MTKSAKSSREITITVDGRTPHSPDVEITINNGGVRVVARDTRGRLALLDLLREIDPALEQITRVIRPTGRFAVTDEALKDTLKDTCFPPSGLLGLLDLLNSLRPEPPDA